MNNIKFNSAVLKFINGSNNTRTYLQGMYEYITDDVKTEGGKLVATHGCSTSHPLQDIFSAKKLHNKTHGKQGEHFVLSLPPRCSEREPLKFLSTVTEIVRTVYPEFMSVIAVHTDSKALHAHVLINSVNSVTGHKFSQSPLDLNRVKQKTNGILKKHGFEIIEASVNDFVDSTDYSQTEDFSFLELDESQFISEAALNHISEETAAIEFGSYFNPINLPVSLKSLRRSTMLSDMPKSDDNFAVKQLLGGNNMSNSNITDTQQVQNAVNVPVNTAAGYRPDAHQAQEVPVSEVSVESVPTTAVPVNNYPNTTLVTGPTFRIHGNENSDLSGLNELVTQTMSYAQEHQRENANLALAMQQHGQQTGFPSNVALFAGPIFDINLM